MDFDHLKSAFFNVLEDLTDYLPDLTLVGGWIPYIYSNYLWKKRIQNPVTTVDIDFGVDHKIGRNYSRTIFDVLSSLGYKEHHPKIDRMFPVVLYKDNIPVEFITYPHADIKAVEQMVGEQVQIDRVKDFDFLIKNRISIIIRIKKKSCLLNCPKPSAFLYHKGETFIYRENKEKQAKDLYYMYFILRFTPDLKMILEEVARYNRDRKRSMISISSNLDKFFERVSSKGCLLVEQQNGPDEYLDDVRQDIYNRFKQLRDVLQETDVPGLTITKKVK